MDPSSLSAGIYSNVQSGSLLGLEMSLHQPLPPPKSLLQNPHHQTMNYANPDDGFHPQNPANPFSAKPKAQTLTLSDDDDPGFTAETSADDGRRKLTSPWQRMKWTDNMVRLLIMIVFYIDDEVVSEAHNHGSNAAADKKKGALQKKGKWKSVSRAMMERGFYVSPQQCEDKFNDLNKRYKRVNDILGKGISCRVVENQSLLDSMDHVSPKLKDEVRKLLNSKHLFFREMCAYHNIWVAGGGPCGGAAASQPPSAAAAASEPQRCLHSTADENNNNSNSVILPKLSKGTSCEDEEDDDEDDDDIDTSNGDEEDDDGNSSDNRRQASRKRAKRDMNNIESHHTHQLASELAGVLQNGGKSRAEKMSFLKMKTARLEEERVGIHERAVEIQRRRLKWLRYSDNKEREMERERLANEQLRLENERMLLLIRHKELALLDHHHHSHSTNRKSDPSSVTG